MEELVNEMAIETDFLVVGGGFVGLSIAYELALRNPDAVINLIEKETHIGEHASGRNSGVLHAGFYYTSDSLKARFTKEGNQAWHQFCEEHNLDINKCGKLVVAKDEEDNKTLDILIERGEANGIELDVISAVDAQKIEPRVKTHKRALWSPNTATVNPQQVLKQLFSEVEKLGVKVHFDCAFINRNSDNQVRSSKHMFKAKHLINCAGLYADKVAKFYDQGSNYHLLPFKGVYLYAGDNAPKLATNIYPVPDLKNPFLGVHYTLTVDGTMKLGPSAIPAFWPEQYEYLENFKIGEFLQTSGRHLQLMAGSDSTFRKLAVEELKKYSKSYMVKQAQQLADGIEMSHFSHWGKPGIRAQLINKTTQKLEMDFIVEGDKESTHVLNAVSPAFTCALPFAKYVVDKIQLS